jgi:hypothetical protein
MTARMKKAARVKRTAFFPVTVLTAAGLRHHPSPVPAGQA